MQYRKITSVSFSKVGSTELPVKMLLRRFEVMFLFHRFHVTEDLNVQMNEKGQKKFYFFKARFLQKVKRLYFIEEKCDFSKFLRG